MNFEGLYRLDFCHGHMGSHERLISPMFVPLATTMKLRVIYQLSIFLFSFIFLFFSVQAAELGDRSRTANVCIDREAVDLLSCD